MDNNKNREVFLIYLKRQIRLHESILGNLACDPDVPVTQFVIKGGDIRTFKMIRDAYEEFLKLSEEEFISTRMSD
jgi:hypothetical protein